MTYISIGLVSETLLAFRALENLGCSYIEDLRSIRITHGVDFETVIGFARHNKWAIENNGSLQLSDIGNKFVKRFDGHELDSNLWRDILFNYIKQCKPAWSSRIPSGRKEAYIFMSIDEKRCFIEADLLTTPASDSVIKWWDTVAEYIRSEHNLKLEETGRQGELFTMRYEETRTGMTPVWESFETNLVGYDIISSIASDNMDQLLIEVKTSLMDINHAKMTLSRHEWNVAVLKRQNSTYKFYLWLIGNDVELAIIDVDEIMKHIPTDKGAGKWQSIDIPFVFFENHFFRVKKQ